MNLKTLTLSRLGYSEYRPLQEVAIDALCAGQDVLLAAPTGGGKSLVYQSAGLIRHGVAVIVSPLLSLMSQQVEELSKKGIRAKFLNSTLNPGEQDDLIWALRHEHIDLLYISPEKLVQPSVIGFLHSFNISLFAIDEAHCISQWGSFFRPEYSQLGQLKESFPNVPIIALTGTVDKETINTIQTSLRLNNCQVLRSSFDRSNIKIQIAQKRKAKQQVLYFLHHEVPGETGIIYCRSRKKTEELADWLSELGLPSLCYHAAMTEEDKQANHNAFTQQPGTIMVATTAYGMGIDIAHVRFVVHIDLPSNAESYFQEVGRAGRDGKPARALLLYGLQDMIQAQQLASLQPFSANKELASVGKFFRVLESRGCRRQNLLAHFDEDLPVCNNCDRCLSNTSEQNVTIASQKLLSLIYYTRGIQPFSLLIQILLGKKTKSVLAANAEKSPLFAKGKELNEVQWKAIIRHLIAFDYITLGTISAFSVHINEKSRSVLKGKTQIIIPNEQYYPTLHEDNLEIGSVNWHKVIAWKYSYGKNVLSDSQLRLICRHKPKSIASLSRLTGLSKDRVIDFADTLLEIVHEMDALEVSPQ
ncbi:RecQ family ATP-dependent DNA helicase [Marinomonas foliarum]|jgi:ATP-dependent DNA helicase RecQ|uniref:ATP-dependent DNA helicase RecQ n=1 Tax=Marinomonas foliarum TaxID=491950 RepID=A0A368ZNU7_9GAMM|nr:ATP-dependent DNA helicase RecQ [Marinomonas foliarum]QRV24096.1 ATP-dependent DNA helicase RecQ [Marinomonas foliarum]RCW94392.1 ATP-dependent DNA helicase RecQ [Marinomonas foliarum]